MHHWTRAYTARTRVIKRQRANITQMESEENAEQRTDIHEAPRASVSSPGDSAAQTAASSAITSSTMTNKQVKAWVYDQYCKQASQPGFKEDDFAKNLTRLKPEKKKKIYQLVSM